MLQFGEWVGVTSKKVILFKSSSRSFYQQTSKLLKLIHQDFGSVGRLDYFTLAESHRYKMSGKSRIVSLI